MRRMLIHFGQHGDLYDWVVAVAIVVAAALFTNGCASTPTPTQSLPAVITTCSRVCGLDKLDLATTTECRCVHATTSSSGGIMWTPAPNGSITVPNDINGGSFQAN